MAAWHVDDILSLQRTAGNRATHSLLAARRPPGRQRAAPVAGAVVVQRLATGKQFRRTINGIVPEHSIEELHLDRVATLLREYHQRVLAIRSAMRSTVDFASAKELVLAQLANLEALNRACALALSGGGRVLTRNQRERVADELIAIQTDIPKRKTRATARLTTLDKALANQKKQEDARISEFQNQYVTADGFLIFSGPKGQGQTPTEARVMEASQSAFGQKRLVKATESKPEQTHWEGWKLHISASPEDVAKVEKLVLPLLRRKDVWHKTFARPSLYTREVTKDTHNAGKLITIYPESIQDLFELMTEIDGLLGGLQAGTLNPAFPTVHGDATMGTTGRLSTRYGEFKSTSAYGRGKGKIWSPSQGKFVEDVRGAPVPNDKLQELIQGLQAIQNQVSDAARLTQEVTALRQQMQ